MNEQKNKPKKAVEDIIILHIFYKQTVEILKKRRPVTFRICLAVKINMEADNKTVR